MKGRTYLDTFRGAVSENKISRYIILGLTIVIFVLSVSLFERKQTIVQIPPGLTQPGTILPDNASPAVKEAWGAYFAGALGNVTPRTADFTARMLQPYVSARISTDLMELIARETKTIKDQSVSTSFVPTDVFYVPSQDVVVVSGEYTMRGMEQRAKSSVKTFVLGVAIRNYLVTLTSLQTNEGPWVPPAVKK
ncbi:TraE/TraK family type IV conjugative transfer system protein [Rhodanobacter sp. FW106-PBR-LB-2-11]|uniref:TraE/TraK family type IV conjugative transfer system protein n=1 Tax=Rhodanobacter sp. FW106-PBR-LB-2-11 TaxID=1524463 RepID=UPI0034E3F0E5